MPAPLTVVSVIGWCRSGSTMLGNLLAQNPSVVHVGELHFLWRNGVLRSGSNSRCGCGAELDACPLWSRVLADVLPRGAALEAHARQVVGWQQQAFRTRHTWRLLRELPRGPAARGYLGGAAAGPRPAGGGRLLAPAQGLHPQPRRGRPDPPLSRLQPGRRGGAAPPARPCHAAPLRGPDGRPAGGGGPAAGAGRRPGGTQPDRGGPPGNPRRPPHGDRQPGPLPHRHGRAGRRGAPLASLPRRSVAAARLLALPLLGRYGYR